MPSYNYFRKPFYANLEKHKTPEQRQQEENINRQKAKQKQEQDKNHFLERYNDFVNTFNASYPDIKNQYAIIKVMFLDIRFTSILLKNFKTKKEQYIHFNYDTSQWHVTKNNCLWDNTKYEILEPLTTKEQMDIILANLG
ncbi:hypothetical protein DCCM_0460 [Desulfocucumis palustris]|uniref:Uncharacterized protein n=1 Tax=Desulfocucumis palustris TaxID=1898651 RepID=A0A2L2X7T8_9FIRM|nr:hypothetical protein [Desulfocucumis palustris]GBF32267.1 hypothetical protein DCCM_0460 [Desulfocucumis palustris]